MSMNELSTVEEYWSGVSQRLQVEADVLNRLVGHNGEFGRANELSLAQLLTNLLPASVGVGTGVVIDSKGNRSAQSDIIVYDKSMQPQILAQSTQLLFPVETTVAVIEVKTSINGEAVNDVGAKAEKLRGLSDSRRGAVPPAFVLFGYTCTGAPATRASELEALPKQRQPDLVCVVKPGMVARHRPASEPLSMQFVPLHSRVNGLRVGRTWKRPDDSERTYALINGSVFPIARFAANAKDRYVFDPGRALLLFCNDVLETLATRGKSGSNWLTNYLPGAASETEPLNSAKT